MGHRDRAQFRDERSRDRDLVGRRFADSRSWEPRVSDGK
jgi:hypothetical protein